MSVYVVTDSTSDIPREIAEAHGITVVPLGVTFGAESFRDGVDLHPDDFFARLQEAKALPTTSQPPPALFEHAYEHLATRGEVVSVHLSHKFSGTVESARSAAAKVAADRISVVDSGSVSMGLGLCVIAAGARAQAGGTRGEVVAAAESVASRLHVAVAFETLEYLRRGGRIGRAQAFVGGLLRVKPILTVRDGEAFPLSRARSRRKAIDELAALAEKFERVDDIVVCYTTTRDDAEELAARVRSRHGGAAVAVGQFGSVLGVYGGPGMLGIAVVESAGEG